MLNVVSKLSVPVALLALFTPVTFSAPIATPDLSAATFSTPLRILPLGDSITFGYINGSGSNGYREELLNRLIASGASVDFVGTQTSGDMADNQNEGHSGWTISQVDNVLGPALNFNPNVVLIHLATNDLNRDETSAEPYSEAPERLGNVIDNVLKQLPNAVVFVAKIIPTTNPESEERFETYNAALPAVVKARADEGFSVVLVDQSVIPTSELSDSLHPSAVGYSHMGDIWADAVVANQALVKPVPS